MNIIEKVKELNMPDGSYVVIGSGPLQVHGIREAKDIDIVVTEDVFDQLKKQGGWQEEVRPNGQKVILKDVYDVGVGLSANGYNPTTEHLIKTADIIDGVAFMNLQEMLVWRKALAREKDLADIKLIEAYLAKQ